MKHLILFDGACALCNGLNRFIVQRDAGAAFVFASIQGEMGASALKSLGCRPDALDTMYVVQNHELEDRVLMSKSSAVLFVLDHMGWPWKLSVVFRIIPVAVLNWTYDLMARNRYAIFGRSDSCPLVQPEHQERFLDMQ